MLQSSPSSSSIKGGTGNMNLTKNNKKCAQESTDTNNAEVIKAFDEIIDKICQCQSKLERIQKRKQTRKGITKHQKQAALRRLSSSDQQQQNHDKDYKEVKNREDEIIIAEEIDDDDNTSEEEEEEFEDEYDEEEETVKLLKSLTLAAVSLHNLEEEIDPSTSNNNYYIYKKNPTAYIQPVMNNIQEALKIQVDKIEILQIHVLNATDNNDDANDDDDDIDRLLLRGTIDEYLASNTLPYYDTGYNLDYDEYHLTKRVVRYLAARAYHLPGNSFFEDWKQYLLNNHPLLGIFFHHKKHPIGTRMRIVVLFATFIFGLGITSVIFLLVLYFPLPIISQYDEAELVLYTLGSCMHSLLNNAIYYMAVCSCCLPGAFFSKLQKYRISGTILTIIVITIFTVVTFFITVYRAIVESSTIAAGGTLFDQYGSDVNFSLAHNNDTIDGNNYIFSEQIEVSTPFSKWNITTFEYTTNGFRQFSYEATQLKSSAFHFIISYLTELTLVFFVYYPITQTILFSGILGCFGKMQWVGYLGLGGRPYELQIKNRERSMIKVPNEKEKQQQQYSKVEQFERRVPSGNTFVDTFDII